MDTGTLQPKEKPFPTQRHDPWLDRWLPLLHERCPGAHVLEIGCGNGEDSVKIRAAGFMLTAFDLDAQAAAATQARVPQATILCRDTRAPLPCSPHSLDAVVAGLSLHYFDWLTTETIMERIRTALRPQGLFLCRLNSTDDLHFGASGHPEIEPRYYCVNGQIQALLRPHRSRSLIHGWVANARLHALRHRQIHPTQGSMGNRPGKEPRLITKQDNKCRDVC